MSKMNTILTGPWVLECAERIAATRSDDLASPYSAVAAFPIRSPSRTTGLYDRRGDDVSLDEVELIRI